MLDFSKITIEFNGGNPSLRVSFDKNNSYQTTLEILMGLYFLKRSNEIGPELDKILKDNEQPEYLIMAYTEIKRIVDETKKDALKVAQDFIFDNDKSSILSNSK